jgi:hypothetical protein
MAEGPSERDVDTRLAQFLAEELRRAECDFANLTGRQRLATRRASSLGVLGAALAVLVMAVVAPRVAPGSGFGTGAVPLGSEGPAASPIGSVPAVSPGSSGAPRTPTLSAPPTSPSAPISRPATFDCLASPSAACSVAIELVRAENEQEVGAASRIVMVDTCPPPAICDRLYPFDRIMVLVTAGGDTTGWYAFHLTGQGDVPTRAEPWAADVPAHVVQILEQLEAES